MRIFSDPHIGRNAMAHTTHTSRQRLDNAIFKNALEAAHGSPLTTVCVGDLFDKANNQEKYLIQGLKVARKCDLILAGNHDLANRENTKTSIEVIEDTLGNIVRAGVSDVFFEHYEDGYDCYFSVVPHHSSQDLFDQALDKCVNSFEGKKDILFLHCNFNNPYAQNDASLNLTPEQAETILTKYRYIVLGHEHGHRWEMGGRLLVVGNTHPTSFGDISDKFYWDYLPKDKTFKPTLCWSKSDKYLQLTVKQLLEGAYSLDGKTIVDITGSNVDPAQAGQIATAMKEIWQNAPELLLLRNNVEYRSLVAQKVDRQGQLEDVTKAISKQLEGSDLAELWTETLTYVGED